MKEKLISCGLFVHSEEFCERLTNLLSEFSCIELTGCLHNYFEAMESTIKNKPIIVFIDVDESELLNHIQHNCFIVGICDKKQAKRLNDYLKMGFFDFLITPIVEKDFKNVMGKILNLYGAYYGTKEAFRMKAAEDNIAYNIPSDEKKVKNSNYVFVTEKGKKGAFKLYYDEVVLLKLIKNVVIIYYDNGSTKTVKNSLKYFQSILPEEKFFKTSRNFVIHLDKVTKILNNDVIMNGNIKIQTSRIFKKELKGKLNL